MSGAGMAKRFGRQPVSAALFGLLGGCTGVQSALDPRSDQAGELLRLIVGIVAVCALVWLAVMAVLALASRRKRPETGRVAPATPRPATERRLTQAVVGATVATALIVAGLTAASFVVTRRIDRPARDALVVRLRGHQFWWEATYADAVPARSFDTANELHVPVGRPVRIELDTDDVIHSFWVPNLAGKLDMIPGRGNALGFTANRAGVYRGQCAEFCGLQHAHMALVVVAEPPEAFEAWRAGQIAAAAVPTSPELEAGRRLFVGKSCSACHTVRGTPAAGRLGPDLTHVGSRRTIAAGTLETTRGAFAAWIADPQTVKPGNRMPAVDLEADELKAISAYMASLR